MLMAKRGSHALPLLKLPNRVYKLFTKIYSKTRTNFMWKPSLLFCSVGKRIIEQILKTKLFTANKVNCFFSTIEKTYDKLDNLLLCVRILSERRKQRNSGKYWIRIEIIMKREPHSSPSPLFIIKLYSNAILFEWDNVWNISCLFRRIYQ